MNGLKEINDTQGHDFGDKYIKSASQIICNSFKHSPVYRIGGDEFVIFLRGQDYQARETLVNTFDKIMYENLLKNEVVISSGLDIYHADKKDTFQIVFERADKKMYARKKILKDIKGSV